MKIVRIYQNIDLKIDDEIYLDDYATYHLVKVLRFLEKKNIVIFNGNGFDFNAVIIKIKKRCCVKIISCEKNNTESTLDLTLAQCIAKGDKMDFIIQKAIELGVNRIIPVNSERCVVRLNEKSIIKRRQHWQKIANHACEQSGRAVIVNIANLETLTQVLKNNKDFGYILHHRAEQGIINLKKPKKATILIGPEGGFSKDEITESIDFGFKPILVGKRVLRTETAAITAIANMQMLWGS